MDFFCFLNAYLLIANVKISVTAYLCFNFIVNALAMKDFDDAFGKICTMLQTVDYEHVAKPDKRRSRKEGGR